MPPFCTARLRCRSNASARTSSARSPPGSSDCPLASIHGMPRGQRQQRRHPMTHRVVAQRSEPREAGRVHERHHRRRRAPVAVALEQLSHHPEPAPTVPRQRLLQRRSHPAIGQRHPARVLERALVQRPLLPLLAEQQHLRRYPAQVRGQLLPVPQRDPPHPAEPQPVEAAGRPPAHHLLDPPLLPPIVFVEGPQRAIGHDANPPGPRLRQHRVEQRLRLRITRAQAQPRQVHRAQAERDDRIERLPNRVEPGGLGIRRDPGDGLPAEVLGGELSGELGRHDSAHCTAYPPRPGAVTEERNAQPRAARGCAGRG